MNDLWELDLASEVYTQIELSENSVCPGARSGHTASIFNGKMYIFGGILELTKELNEMLCYSFETKSFVTIGSDTNEQNMLQSNLRAQEEGMSPGTKKNNILKK